jgi:hypothetical protein
MNSETNDKFRKGIKSPVQGKHVNPFAPEAKGRVVGMPNHVQKSSP